MKKINLLFVTFLFSITLFSSSWAQVGKYAILLYGGYQESGNKINKALPTNQDYMYYEIAPMFNLLIDSSKYGYANENIYIHVLHGNEQLQNSYSSFFVEQPVNFLPGTMSDYGAEFGLDTTFQKLNKKIYQDNFDDNILFVFISGHQKKGPEGSTNYYQTYDDSTTDAIFASIIDNYLVDGTYDITEKVKLVFVTGFCASWYFYDPEIQNVCYTASYAAADSENASNTIRTWPNSSLMSYYVSAMDSLVEETPTFHRAFFIAESLVHDYWPTINDDPYKGTIFEGTVEDEGAGWDRFYTLKGILPPSYVSISADSTESGAISISFSSTRAESCYVYYDTNSGVPYTGSGATEGSSPVAVALTNGSGSLTLSGLTNGQRYYIAVKGKNYNGESPYSNEINQVSPITTSGTI